MDLTLMLNVRVLLMEEPKIVQKANSTWANRKWAGQTQEFLHFSYILVNKGQKAN